MSHPRPSLLHRYALGEADGDERLIVERHADSCPACRAGLAAERCLDELLVQAGGTPADATLDRSAFDGLWVHVDAAPPVVASPWRAWRAAAAVLLGLGLLTWWWSARSSGEARAPVEVASAPEAVPSMAPPAVAPPAEVVPPPPPLDAAEVARLAAVREELRAALAAAQRGAPLSRPDFLDAAEPALAAHRAEGWPVERLVAGLVADADPDVAQAALRLAAGTREGQADVAACLRDGQRAAAALDALQAASPRPAASATLVDALSALVQPSADGGTGALDLPAARLLAADAGPEAREALGRALDRALAAIALVPAADTERADATHERLFALAAAAPAELVAQRAVSASSARADEAGELLARAAARDADACSAGLLRAVEGARPETGRRLAKLAAPRDLSVAMPALLAALAAHPEDAELQAAAGRLATAADLAALAELLGSQRGRAREQLDEMLLVALRRDATLIDAAGAVLASDVDAAVRLARSLGVQDPAHSGSTLLLAALAARPAGRASLPGTSTLLSALAGLGSTEAGAPLLAWIGTRPSDDPCLPLAWTAAARLAPAPALSRWTRDVGDPQLLARAADGGQAWPAAAPSPPRRLLDPLRAALLDVSRDRNTRHPAGSPGLPESR